MVTTSGAENESRLVSEGLLSSSDSDTGRETDPGRFRSPIDEEPGVE